MLDVKVKRGGAYQCKYPTTCAYCPKSATSMWLATFHCDNLPSELKYLFDREQLFCSENCIRFHQIELSKL